MSINQRIGNLRKTMKNKGLDAYIIPSNDNHQSEYVPDHWKSREWISGFTGSAGTVVITMEEAQLWTDSRYFLQAETELADSEMVLHKPVNRFAPEHIQRLADTLQVGAVIGMDGDACMVGQAEQYNKILTLKNMDFETSHDLMDEVWTDRPSLPTDTIFEHEVAFAGKSRKEKITDIITVMESMGVDHHLVTTLDDIAWIFNIRGTDIEFNPVVVAFALISKQGATLFIDAEKIESGLQKQLASDGVTIKPYEEINSAVESLRLTESILVDTTSCSVALYQKIGARVKTGETISTLMKGKKSATEIAHTKVAMAKDGAAIARSFHWLEQQLKTEAVVTEAGVADQLQSNRSKMDHYQGESFPAIVGYKGNGAIIHYRPMHGNCATLRADGILLVDSGGQYLDGTTDITRTIALGTPSKEEKRNFTLVLKGMIGLTRMTFPKGTAGAQLDPLARMHLWEHGLDYGHGTGHGVGFFLNVHEGPQGISGLNSSRGRLPLQVGMITSNEPGYYKEGAYGIRIENLIATVPSDHEGFLEFDTLTLYPIDIKMIDETIFSKSEKAWLNNYHYKVLKEVGPYLTGDVKSWFELKCRPMN